MWEWAAGLLATTLVGALGWALQHIIALLHCNHEATQQTREEFLKFVGFDTAAHARIDERLDGIDNRLIRVESKVDAWAPGAQGV